MRRLLVTLLVLTVIPVAISAQTSLEGLPQRTVTSADVVGITHWSADTVWLMNGKVYVEPGEVLIIEPGTIIKGEDGELEAATALVVMQGGRIYAEGTPQSPIIFTTKYDNVYDPNDIVPVDTKGLWGGVILLGYARVNNTTGEGNIEGIPVTDDRGKYGGGLNPDDDDNSGILKYVSIRHGGIGIAADNEINGLTMGGVGRGTVISHVEVFANFDDGFEFFGGTVNTDHLTAAFCGDDSYDWDQGFAGSGQFWFSIGDPDSDHGGEHDGGTSPKDGVPFTTTCVSNATFIGGGVGVNPDQSRAFWLDDVVGGAYLNSIFTDHGEYGVCAEEDGSLPRNAIDNVEEGQFLFKNNFWWDCGPVNTTAGVVCGDPSVAGSIAARLEAAIFGSGNDLVFDPQIANITRTNDGTLDPRPLANFASGAGWMWIDPLGVDGYNPVDPAGYPGAIDAVYKPYDVVDYPGAFAPGERLWVCGWTALDAYGYIEDCGEFADFECITDDGKAVNVVTNADVDGFTVWDRDHVWQMSGKIYVEPSDTLLIEPGTIIKGEDGELEAATALVVMRDGLAYVLGCADCPAIFTSIYDDVDEIDDIVPFDTKGLWGGVIVLGNARVNNSTGEGNIEGIPVTDNRGTYGGGLSPDDNDNSGVYRYLSVRHGGIGIAADNEINGFTMGGVGAQTVISHVEVFANFDDGFEWFGGNVHTDHLSVAFCGDDSFDWDQGFGGSAQYWFAIGDPNSDHGGEHDGGTSPKDGTPFTTNCVSNATIIGGGVGVNPDQSRAFWLDDCVAGAYLNSIFTDHGEYGICAEEDGSLPRNAIDNIVEGQFLFKNNFWWDCGPVNTTDAIVCGDPSVAGSIAERLETAIFGSGNDAVSDPQLRNISRLPDGTLDPRACADLSGWSWIDPLGVDGYNPVDPAGYAGAVTSTVWRSYEVVDYVGAFDPDVAIEDSWVGNWTALHRYGYIGNMDCTGGGCCAQRVGDANQIGGDEPTIGDISVMIDAKFITGNCVGPDAQNPILPCLAEADINQSGGADPTCDDVTIGDISVLIDYLFITGPSLGLPDCL